ncbi:hypothetical protein M2459_000765 [Parabacteroides sp. PF5-5]|uniref:DUF2945 domain-containing protein n=1 Tax=unclassified Parabacteroides TaxID=2649774 RepID=UPI002473BEC5|nr:MULTISPECIES: DUF2945 domain-containing protein [unclassified Parabacteroides]MDH6304038.1 hypothetical protein [Parabacteroides sp. PH5-39]MDH6315247.1 hypothetical protein [Parabacteroides sp. PF5-13]MDH6318907.1 hypothetical protein [Parabacteroides sp. PH5-13]MDH6322636.1 hypothetical protein [Parabacteroides sp. PH5-8]MDH6326227.1 hypothetical protein [Parabacteroides sp. PH5-41]
MDKTIKIGDHVSWNSESGRVSGKIIKIHTSAFYFELSIWQYLREYIEGTSGKQALFPPMQYINYFFKTYFSVHYDQ